MNITTKGRFAALIATGTLVLGGLGVAALATSASALTQTPSEECVPSPAIPADPGQPYIAPTEAVPANPGQPYIAPTEAVEAVTHVEYTYKKWEHGQWKYKVLLSKDDPWGWWYVGSEIITDAPAVPANPGQPYIAPTEAVPANPGQPYIAPTEAVPAVVCEDTTPVVVTEATGVCVADGNLFTVSWTGAVDNTYTFEAEGFETEVGALLDAAGSLSWTLDASSATFTVEGQDSVVITATCETTDPEPTDDPEPTSPPAPPVAQTGAPTNG